MGVAPLLRAGLQNATGILLGLDDMRAFVDGQCKRLLTVDVLTGLHGGNRDQRVPVIDRGADHGVDILLLQELAEIGIGLCRRIPPLEVRHVAFVDVAEGDDLAVRGRALPISPVPWPPQPMRAKRKESFARLGRHRRETLLDVPQGQADGRSQGSR